MAVSPDSENLGNKYSKVFPGTNRHHPIPVSRIPCSVGRREARENDLIVFPYLTKAHRAYHALFWNLRIDQVWSDLSKIHFSIFCTGEEIYEWWLEGCDLESADSIFDQMMFARDKQNRLSRKVGAAHLRNLWFRAFGGEDLATAENFLKLMMLFMVFGSKMLDQDKLFDNGNLSHFFENTRPSGSRLWAFKNLFGDGGSVQGIKSKMSRVLNKNKFYIL